MSEKDQPIRNESWIAFFWRRKRFTDFILLAWQLIEFNMNQLLSRQFDLAYFEEKAVMLLEQLTFDRKLEILRRLGIIDKEDCSVVKEFQQYRNRLFHGNEPWYYLMSDTEKEPIAKNAYEAVMILQSIGFGSRYPKKERIVWPPPTP